MQQDMNRWKSRFDYATKVREPARVAQDVSSIAELGESLRSSGLMCLAGILAHLSGLGAARARSYLEQALEMPQRVQAAAVALAAQAIEQQDWSRAASHLLQAVQLDGDHDATSLIRTLGQCAIRVPRAALPPVGLLYSLPLTEVARRMANSLIAIVVKDDATAFRAALAGNVELLRRTKSGNDIFEWGESASPQPTTTPTKAPLTGGSEVDPRRGRVSAYYQSRGFGFIVEDSTGQTWFFHKSSVASDALFGGLIEGRVRQDVTFEGKIEMQLGKYPQASRVVALSEGVVAATESPARAPLRVRLATVPKDGSSYARAKEAEQLDQLTRAERLFAEEIAGRGSHSKSAIKDLAMLLNRKGDSAGAVALLDAHRLSFEPAERASLDKMKAHFHVKAKRYTAAAALLSVLAKQSPDWSKQIEYLRQEAYCLYANGDLDESIAKLVLLMKKAPNDNATQLLLARAREAKHSGLGPEVVPATSDDYDTEDVLASLALGLSSIARRQLDECELRGLDARTKESRQFSAKDFQALERLLESLRGRRPRERADYLLTLATLCELCPEAAGRHSVHSLLRRHFAALAEALMVESAHRDVVRCFAIESLSLSPVDLGDRLDSHFEAAWVLLLGTYYSHTMEPTELLRPEPGQRLAHIARALHKRPEDWRRFVEDSEFYRMRIGSALQQLVARLARLGIDAQIPGDALSARLRFREDDSAFAALVLDNVSADRIRQARESLSQRLPSARFELDKLRLSDLIKILSDTADYALERHFRERETRFLRLDTEIGRCLDEWARFPTHLSVERMSPALASLRDLLRSDFAHVEETKPTLELRNVLDNDFYVENEGIVALRLLLSSRDESAPPIEAISLVVGNGENEPCHSPEPLHGGQSREIELAVTPTEKQIADRAFAVDVMVEYRTRRGTSNKTGGFPLAVRLGEPAFVKIANPYGRYSGGLPVEDDSMFFGRAALIGRIVEYLSGADAGQCFVLYGQKRSGKSSVLMQVERRVATSALFVSLRAGALVPGKLWCSFARRFVEELAFMIKDRGEELTDDWPSWQDIDAAPLEAIIKVSRLVKKRGHRIVVAVDEFTYIYEHSEDEVSDLGAFMRGWKALLETKLFNALLVGQDTMRRFMLTFPNEFAVIHDERISYLEVEEAERLASEPILLDGATRYRGQALHRLYRLTAGSPFFLQITCDRLVRHLNARSASFVTEADIDQVARSMTVGFDALPPERFDPLVTASGERVATVARDDLWRLLARVARESLHSDWCYRAALAELPNAELAVNDLIERDILTAEGERVSIRVGLFASWLRANQ